MWFHYKKTFDSVPHSWVIKLLELAKVTKIIMELIKQLMQLRSTKVFLPTADNVIETAIKYCHIGKLEGDCLSLMLFIISVKPLYFLLNTLRYKIG